MAGSSNPEAPCDVPRKKQRTEDGEKDNRIAGNQGAGYQESGDQDYSQLVKSELK